MSSDDLKSKLNWINESKNSLMNGFGDYTFKDFKKKNLLKEEERPSIFLITSLLFSDDIGGTSKENQYCSELYNFIANYEIPEGELQGQYLLDCIDESKLTAKAFTEIMITFLNEFESNFINKI